MGVVFDIQRCSYHDGPGIRTAVFLKGCNLRCLWCHNPESFEREPQIELLPALCVGCGACEGVCPNGVHSLSEGVHRIAPSVCTRCGLCIDACPSHALRIAGREMTADDVIAIVIRDRAYYESSGGGVTFTGGEPLCQPAFLLELLTKCREAGISTAVETNGCVSKETLLSLLPFIDLVLLDLKADNDLEMRAWTGGDFMLWRQTLDLIEVSRGSVVLRLPIIPTFNDSQTHIRFAADLKRRYRCIRSIELLPYHTIGNTKWTGIGLDIPLKDLPPADADHAAIWNRWLEDALHTDE